MRILVTDRAWPDLAVERTLWEPLQPEVIDAPAQDEATLLRLVVEADAIAVCWAKLSPALVQAAQKCRVISRFGIGLDNIPVGLCTELGILVTNVPDYCVDEVAEHTLAMVLAIARNVLFFDRQTKAGQYALAAAPEMHRLRGRVLGLAGFGRIGQAVARRATALGLTVIAWSRSGNHGSGVEMVSFAELLRRSDWLSLHLPLSPESRGLFGLAEFERMKPSARLINTSRGGLVDPAGLLEALERGLIAGAALDVFEPEPPDLTQPLYRHEQVIVTPHAAFLSVESLLELRSRGAQRVAEVLSGRRPADLVNPEVLENPRCRLKGVGGGC